MHPSIRSTLVLAACAATIPMATAAQAHDYDPETELNGPGYVEPMKNQGVLSVTEHGYRYQAGQQNSHLVMRVTASGRLRFDDTRTQELKRYPASCRQVKVSRGIAASCSIPASYTAKDPMYLEIWPRLGDDFVDGSRLPVNTRLWALLDAGNDTAYGGDGEDFINGAQDNDIARGGAGNDWIRTGIGNDQLAGGSGNDDLLGVDGNDTVHGGSGDDTVGGGNGDDRLSGGAGTDWILCGTGNDVLDIDRFFDRLHTSC